MMIRIALMGVILTFQTARVFAQEYTVVSPNQKIRIELNRESGNPGGWFLKIVYHADSQVCETIPKISLGMIRSDQEFSNNLNLLKAGKPRLITEQYTALHGKRGQRSNSANEVVFAFENTGKARMNLIVRAYNDGVAFRYEFPEKKGVFKVQNELTSYDFPDSSARWLQKFDLSNEGLYLKSYSGDDRQNWCYPALFNSPDSAIWCLIHEAGLDRSFCATKLSNHENPKAYKVTLPHSGEGEGEALPTISLPWKSPWRVIILGSLSDIVESTLVEDVSPPSVIASTNWINPGLVSWNYWSDNRVVCNSTNTPTLSWRLSDNTTTFRSPHAKSLDYVVFYGDKADDVIASYRTLSGNTPLFPKWAYGYWQCRERYTSAAHLVETVNEFRNRQLPMDVIVQDWQYWGAKGWGVPVFDETNYPNPSGFIKELHDQNASFAISIWSNPDKSSSIGRSYVDRGLFIPGTKWLDYFNPETRKEYWNTLKENMFDHGVDAWWMDAVEPENDALKGVITHIGPGDFYRLTYPLMVSKAVYEGQRGTTDQKRVCILTRSAFAGQQRYGVVNWSGDVGWDWDAYRRQIVAGLNFTLTGLPYWTTDIGGFFRPGSSQYDDKAYHELLTRWFQWGAFSPVFRMHGYQSETEPWKYGPVVEENMRKMLNLRYRLLPYIYSEAWNITSKGSTMMRPLTMDFSKDRQAVSQPYEYMFGQSFLVAPVTQPNVTEQQVYLPASSGWYDFWTGKKYSGGQTVMTEAPLDKIPLFVKSGSIVPMGKFIQYSDQKSADTLEIRIYKGDSGAFELYEDEGDNYNYEKGFYSIIPFEWDEQEEVLTIGERQGEFEGLLKERFFNIVWVNERDGYGIGFSRESNLVAYNGKNVSIKIGD